MMPKLTDKEKKLNKKIQGILKKKDKKLFDDAQRLKIAADFLTQELSNYLKEKGHIPPVLLPKLYESTVDTFLEISPLAKLEAFNDPQNKQRLFAVEPKKERVSIIQLMTSDSNKNSNKFKSMLFDSLRSFSSLVKSSSFIKKKESREYQKINLEKLFEHFEAIDLNENIATFDFPDNLEISSNKLPTRDTINGNDIFPRLMQNTYKIVYLSAKFPENKKLKTLLETMLNIYCKEKQEKEDLIKVSKYLADGKFIDTAKNFLLGLEGFADRKPSKYLQAFSELQIKIIGMGQDFSADYLLPMLIAAFVLAGADEKHAKILSSLEKLYGYLDSEAYIFTNISISLNYYMQELKGPEYKIIPDQNATQYVELMKKIKVGSWSEIIEISAIHHLEQNELEEIGKIRDAQALQTSLNKIIMLAQNIGERNTFIDDKTSQLLLAIARLGEMLQNGFTQKELDNLSQTLELYSSWFVKSDNLPLSLFLDELEISLPKYDCKHLAGLRYGITAVRTLRMQKPDSTYENTTLSLENFIKDDFLKNAPYRKTIEQKICEFKQHVKQHVPKGEDRDKMLKFAREIRQHTTAYYGSAEKNEEAKNQYKEKVQSSFSKAYTSISTHRGPWFKHMTYSIIQVITVVPIFYRFAQFALADKQTQESRTKGFYSFFNGSTQSEDKARDLLETIKFNMG